MKWFGYKKHYNKLLDGKAWNRKGILAVIANEASGLNASSASDSITFKGEGTVKFDFISSNYADPDKIELNASVSLIVNGKTYDWVDLFHFTKQFYPKKYRPLSIFKDQAWEGSPIQEEALNIYIPLAGILVDSRSRANFLVNGEASWNGHSLKLSDNGDFNYKASAQSLARQMGIIDPKI